MRRTDVHNPARAISARVLQLVVAGALTATGCGRVLPPPPSPTPFPSPSSSPSASPSPTTTPTPFPSPTASPTPSPSPSPTGSPTPVPRPIRIEIKKAHAHPKYGAFVSGRVLDNVAVGKSHRVAIHDAQDQSLSGTDKMYPFEEETWSTSKLGTPPTEERGFELYQRTSKPLAKVGDRVVVKVFGEGDRFAASGAVELTAWTEAEQKADCSLSRKEIADAMNRYRSDSGQDRKVLDAAWFAALREKAYLSHVPDDPGSGPGSSANFREFDLNAPMRVKCQVHGFD